MKTYNYGITTYYITILQISIKKFNREISQKLMLHFYQLHFVWKSKRKIINNKKLKSNENWLTPQTPLTYSKCLKTYESARLRPRCAASLFMSIQTKFQSSSEKSNFIHMCWRFHFFELKSMKRNETATHNF